MRMAFLALALNACGCVGAFAQTTMAAAELSAGISLVDPSTNSSERGWFLSGVANLSRWFGVVALVDWSTSEPVRSTETAFTRGPMTGGTVAAEIYDLEIIQSQRSLLGGGRLTARRPSQRFTMYVQALAGYNTRNAPATVAPARVRPGFTPDSGFAQFLVGRKSGASSGRTWQLGGGAAIAINRHLGAVVGVDYRRAVAPKTGEMLDLEENQGIVVREIAHDLNFAFGISVQIGRR